MTLGLPDHLVGTSVGRALAQATHWFGLTCLVGALVSIAVLGISHPSAQIGVSLIGILSMAILLFLLSRHRTVLLSVAYLLVGSVVTYVVSVT
ncbi:ATP-binding protein, partial [Cryobacterium sp. 10I1]|nr:ATP-binding protein [Cryobacterium sp. 10I1]